MSLESITQVMMLRAHTRPSERLVLLNLAYHHNSQSGQCNPSVVTIAEESGLTRRGVQLALHGLSNKKLLIRHPNKELGKSMWTYSLTIPMSIAQPQSEQNSPQARTNFASKGEKHSPKKEYEPKKEHIKFIKPTYDDVSAYCKEQGYTDIDPIRFVDFYTAKGWTIGSSAMKDWKATVRNWHRRNNETTNKAVITGEIIKNPSMKESDYVF